MISGGLHKLFLCVDELMTALSIMLVNQQITDTNIRINRGEYTVETGTNSLQSYQDTSGRHIHYKSLNADRAYQCGIDRRSSLR